MALIDRVILKGRHVVIPEILQRKALIQLHINHVLIKIPELLGCQSIY